jgi:hypothetical protein
MKIASIDAIHLRIEDPNIGLFDGSYDDCLIVVTADDGRQGIGEVESFSPAIVALIDRRNLEVMTGKWSDPERRRFPRPARIWGGGRIVYGRSRTLPPPPSAHDRFRRRVSLAAPPPASCRPRAVTTLRASPPREDPAPQDRVGEPRELARVAGSR